MKLGNSTAGRQQRVALGRFGAVYGIKGWLRLNSFTSPVENICEYGQLQAELQGNWRTITVDDWRLQGKGLIVHVEGFDVPETARTLTGTTVWVESSAMPSLPEGEFYWHQLEGLRVVNKQGLVLGTVAELMETGANDVLVVKPDGDSIDQRERLIPYIAGSVIIDVDLTEATIRVDWEADYLE